MGPIDLPRDIWSMAYVVVEMCTGNIQWKDMQMQQIMRTVCDHRHAPDVPDTAPAADMLCRCFAFDKAQLPTGGQMVSSMRQMHIAAAMRGPAEGARILSERQCEELRAENDQLRVNLRQVTDAQAGLELRLRGQYDREKHALEQQVESLHVQLQGIGQRHSGKYKDAVGTGTCTDCPAGKYREKMKKYGGDRAHMTLTAISIWCKCWSVRRSRGCL